MGLGDSCAVTEFHFIPHRKLSFFECSKGRTKDTRLFLGDALKTSVFNNVNISTYIIYPLQGIRGPKKGHGVRLILIV